MYTGQTPLAMSSLAGPVLYITHLCTRDEHLSPCLPWQAQCFTSHIYVHGTNTSHHVFPDRPSASHHTSMYTGRTPLAMSSLAGPVLHITHLCTRDEHLSPCLPWQAQCFTSHIYVHGTNTSHHVFPDRPSASHHTFMYTGRTPLAMSSLTGPVLHITHLCTRDEHLSPCLHWQAQCFTSHIYVHGTNTSHHVFPDRPSASHHTFMYTGRTPLAMSSLTGPVLHIVHLCTRDEHLSSCLP